MTPHHTNTLALSLASLHADTHARLAWLLPSGLLAHNLAVSNLPSNQTLTRATASPPCDAHEEPAVPCRKAVLPLISKRWARVLRGPSHAWRDAEVGGFYDTVVAVDDLGQETEKLHNAATALAWFKARPG